MKWFYYILLSVTWIVLPAYLVFLVWSMQGGMLGGHATVLGIIIYSELYSVLWLAFALIFKFLEPKFGKPLALVPKIIFNTQLTVGFICLFTLMFFWVGLFFELLTK